MISEGVDINGEDICGMSGLISASIMGNSEVIRILLSCRNIKIDSKDVAGWTALHWACSLGKTESVKSFLEHPTCNKDIVEMKSESGYTAEKRAKKTGNQECVRLIRKYIEEDARKIDDLVEFITGGKTVKKKGKRRLKSQVHSSENPGCSRDKSKTVNISAKGSEDANKTKQISDSKEKISKDTILEGNSKQSEISYHEKENIQTTSRDNLEKARHELEDEIAEKRVHFDAHEEKYNAIIGTKSGEIDEIVILIENSQVEKNIKLNEVDKLDKELSDLEMKISELKLRKDELLEESINDDKTIQNFKDIKHKLEVKFEKELEVSKEKGNIMKDEILYLESKLQKTEEKIKTFPNDEKPISEPNIEFLKFIDDQISEKEKELECPVCLEVACSPIFMCSDQHLICSTCRAKLSNCPECRGRYRGKNKRHRYAEKTAEELKRLKDKKDQVGKYSS